MKRYWSTVTQTKKINRNKAAQTWDAFVRTLNLDIGFTKFWLIPLSDVSTSVLKCFLLAISALYHIAAVGLVIKVYNFNCYITSRKICVCIFNFNISEDGKKINGLNVFVVWHDIILYDVPHAIKGSSSYRKVWVGNRDMKQIVRATTPPGPIWRNRN